MRRAWLGPLLGLLVCSGGAATPPRSAPGFRWRGVLEGFYGRPWSWRARRELLPWMAERGLNLFVLAPKDDDRQRREWREPLPPDELRELGRLCAAARANSVEIAWALSPGLDLRARDPAEVDAAVGKYDAVLRAGVGRLVLAFDDTEPRPEHVAFANAVLARLRAAHPGVDMTFIPAQYWSAAAPSAYLDGVARGLDADFRIGYSGPQIISRRIEEPGARAFRGYVRHPLALGDNYPVQDRLSRSGRLFLGPLVGRDPALARDVDVWLANVTPLPEASRIPLATVADFARDPERYEPAKSWSRELAAAGGPARAALELLARECSSSWLSGSVPGGFEDALRAFARGEDRGGLERRLDAAARLPAALAALPSAELRRELEPWAEKLAAEARAARETVRPRPDPARLEALRRAAERNPAVVSDLAFERFLAASAQGTRRPAEEDVRTLRALVDAYVAVPSGAPEAALRARLARLSSAAPLLRDRKDPVSADVRELDPWVRILALAASRADAAVARRGAAESWRRRLSGPLRALFAGAADRAALVPLWASRSLLDALFDELESGWSGAPRARPTPWVLRVWLAARARLGPDSVPVRLDRALRARRGGDAGPLKSLLAELRDLPSAVPRDLRDRLPEETEPWLDAIGRYGAAGLAALELQERSAGRPSEAELAAWRARRDELRSGNGFELALEVKLDLDALRRWLARPVERRPALPDRSLPADPGDVL